MIWERDSQPCNGSRSVCLHQDGGLSVSKPRFGEWTNCVSGSEYEYGDVVGWVNYDSFPFESLAKKDLIALLRTGITREGIMEVDEVTA